VRYRRQPLPAPPAGPSAQGLARLPLSCWLLAGLVAAGVVVEFCVVYFGAELLTATGLRTSQAATAMSAFYLGILVGRAGGVGLTRRAGRTVPLLWASLAVTAAGFLLFWLARRPVPAITGLFVCGLGVASLYPLSAAVVLASAPGNEDAANAATQLVVGVLAVAAPYLLGLLADAFGLHAAFSVELGFVGLSAVLLFTGFGAARRPDAG
jgi:MFS family permease